MLKKSLDHLISISYESGERIARSNEIREENFLHVSFEANLCCRYYAAAAAALFARKCTIANLSL